MKNLLRLLIILGIAALGAVNVYAYSSYLSSFTAKYPSTVSSQLNGCVLCHINPAGGGSRNPFGTDFASASIGNHTFNTALEARDSDGDGYTNIQEIQALTFPGDATSHPAAVTTCTSFTYSAWGACQSNGTQTRTVLSSSPSGCTGGSPVLTQTCTYVPPTNICTSFTYSAWGACQPDGTQTRTVVSSSPSGCTGGSPILTQTCTYVPPAPTGNGTITGMVKDIVTGAAISGAVVSDGTRSATTSSAGTYTLNEAAGNYTLSISSSGYLTTHQVAAVTSGAATAINWALTKSYGKQTIPAKNMNYVIFAWNDLGMHCDQDDYSYFMVLPPYNTLRAQIFRRGSEGASIITSGITVSYAFPKKTNSALHTNFWTYAKQYGFNVPANVGITGTPLAGNMSVDANGLGWEAVGIPITPYDDDGTWDPYGTAIITVKDSSGNVLQTVNVVAPVSTEMMCSNCHGTTNPQLNILQAHDAYNGTTLASDQANGKVHACAECHSDNVLGASGKTGVESLSYAMHNFHQDKMTATTTAANTTPGCYNCHPGPKTQCLRGIMFRAGKTCTDCHGDMAAMASSVQSASNPNGRQPWLEEPQCGSCHGASYSENSDTLFRNSVLQNAASGDMNNRLYCEGCHNGTHAELTTANPADPTIPQKFQGDNYWIWNCTVCHSATQQNMHRAVSTTGTGGTTTTSYTITASAGTGGSINPSGSVSVTSGGSQSFSITPTSGYKISNVVVDGASVGAVSSYAFTNVTANHTISASFTATTTTTYYTITAKAGTGGSISPSGSVSVASGSSKTFYITAASGYRIYRVVVDGNSVGKVSSYTFSNVTKNHAISASFSRYHSN